MKSDKNLIFEEEMKHICCNGYAQIDDRMGAINIFYIHEKECKEGKKESQERNYWDRERR